MRIKLLIGLCCIGCPLMSQSLNMEEALQDSNTTFMNRLLDNKLLEKTTGQVRFAWLYGRIPYTPFAYSEGGTSILFESDTRHIIGKVPIQVTSFYCSLKDQYNSNHISTTFDREAYIDNLHGKLKQKIEDQLKSEGIDLNEINKAAVKLDHIEYLIDNEIKLDSISQDYDKALSALSELESRTDALKLAQQNTIHHYDSLKAYNVDYYNSEIILLGDSLEALNQEIHSIESNMSILSSNLEKIQNTKNAGLKLAEEAEELRNKLSGYSHYVYLLKLIEEKKSGSHESLQLVATEFGLIDKFERIIMGISDLQVGNAVPHVSPMLIWGIPTRGASVQYQLGNFQIGGGGGKLSFYPGMDSTNERKVAYAFIGKGNHDNYVRLGMLLGLDKFSNTSKSEINNHVYNLSSNYQIAEGKIRFNCEMAVSVDKLRSGVVRSESRRLNYNDVHPLLQILFGPNVDNAEIGIAGAFNVDMNLNKGRTLVNLGGSKVDPLFKSYGTYYIRQDRLKYDFKFGQKMFKGKVQFVGWTRRSEDNRFHFNTSLTTISTTGLTMSIKPKKLPSISFSYLPMNQIHESSKYNYQSWISNLSFGKKIGEHLIFNSSLFVQSNKSVSNVLPDSMLISSLVFGHSFYIGWKDFRVQSNLLILSNDEIQENGSNAYYTVIDFSLGGVISKVNIDGGVKADMLQSKKFGSFISMNIPLSSFIFMSANAEYTPDMYNPYFDIHMPAGWFGNVSLTIKI